MNKFTERTECIFCKETDLISVFKEDTNIPQGSYCIKNQNDLCEFMPFNVLQCRNCNTYQTKYLGDLQIIYGTNHADSFGDVLKQMREQFTNFVVSNSDITNIIEIGAGGGLISDMILEKLKCDYYIIDPSYFGKRENKIIIDKYFEDVDVSKITANTVIMSHVFEHFYDPKSIIEQISQNDNIEHIYLNFPDLEAYVKQNTCHVLNPEHTYYITSEFLEKVFEEYQFKCIKKKFYADHSIFFEFKKDNTIIPNDKPKNNSDIHLSVLDYYLRIRNKVYEANKILNDKTDKEEVYIWPCSMHTYYLMSLGLEYQKLNGILDNSNLKVDHYMYGYKLKCESFDNKIKENRPVTILLNGGCFNKEIIELEKNENVKFITLN
jgi:hypothetical protein